MVYVFTVRMWEQDRTKMLLTEDIQMPDRRRATDEENHTLTTEDLGFAGVGRSAQGALSPVSERHDEALAEAVAHRLQPSRPKHGVRQ